MDKLIKCINYKKNVSGIFSSKLTYVAHFYDLTYLMVNFFESELYSIRISVRENWKIGETREAIVKVKLV